MKATYQNRPWPFISYHLKDYTFSPHLHNQIEVVYILSGYCSITIDSISYPASCGNLFLILPYQIHSFSDTKDCELIVQVFDPDYAAELIPYLNNTIPQCPFLSDVPCDCANALIKAEDYYFAQADSRIIRAYVSLYMSFLYDRFCFVPSSVSDHHSVLHSLLHYVDAHFTEKLTLDLLAHELHVTKYYISRIFSHKLQTSFTDYVNQLRLEYAITLLQTTDCPINEIAYLCGFECERTFFRAFRKHMNMTPSYFRNKK